MPQNDGEEYKKYLAPFAQEDQYKSGDLEAIEIDHLESKVRFSLKHCDTDRKYCIKNVTKDSTVLQSLYKRMGHFEDMTWQLAMDTAREGGLSVEKRDTNNYKILKASYGDFDTYAHVRVSASKKSAFRIFGAVRDGLFYVLRFDIDGKMNH